MPSFRGINTDKSKYYDGEKRVYDMLTNEEILLTVLYLCGGSIRGLTRLHKIMFLLQKELNFGNFVFKPSNFGPWSANLNNLLRRLEEENLIRIVEVEEEFRPHRENPLKIITTTARGFEKGKEIFRNLEKKDRISAILLKRKVKTLYNSPLIFLITYIYVRYPEFATMSTIREKAPSALPARSPFLRPLAYRSRASPHIFF